MRVIAIGACVLTILYSMLLCISETNWFRYGVSLEGMFVLTGSAAGSTLSIIGLALLARRSAPSRNQVALLLGGISIAIAFYASWNATGGFLPSIERHDVVRNGVQELV